MLELKKISITGHTAGIGRGLYEHFKNKSNEYEIIGLSRSNGFDITKNIDEVIESVLPTDCFVSNAFAGFSNVELLYRVFEKWKDSHKLIINISSDSGDGIKNFIHPYAIVKSATDKACEQLQSVDIHVES